MNLQANNEGDVYALDATMPVAQEQVDPYAFLTPQVTYTTQLEAANKENDPLGLVLYTDGGWRANPDMGGFGVHGYFYTDKEPKQGTGCKDATLTCNGYLKKDVKEKPVTILGYVDGCGGILNSTNNIAEVEALIVALNIALVNNVTMLTVKIDSEYALKGASERITKMRAMDFQKPDGSGPMPNADYWRVVSELLLRCEQKNITIKWLWVKGHSDSVGNNKADILATRGISMGRNDVYDYQIFFRPRNGYWNPNAEYNRFLNESRWYFQTGVKDNGEKGYYTYRVGSHGPDDKDHGKPASDIIYGVVRLKEKDAVLSTLEEFVNKNAPDSLNRIMIGRLDFIFNPNYYNDIVNGGIDFLMRKGPRLDYFINDKTPLLAELDPPRRGLDAAVELNRLELILERVLAGDEPHNYVVNDITDLIYETDSSKKKSVTKIRSHIDTSLASITVPVKSPVNAEAVDVTLSLGIDTPKRNLMAALASDTPRVCVVAWRESDMAFRYATVMQSEHNVGIWASVYSNIRILSTNP